LQHRNRSPPATYQPSTRPACSRCLRRAPPATTALVVCIMAAAAASHAALKGCGRRAWALHPSPSAVSAYDGCYLHVYVRVALQGGQEHSACGDILCSVGLRWVFSGMLRSRCTVHDHSV
jgi:hypothetical protein